MINTNNELISSAYPKFHLSKTILSLYLEGESSIDCIRRIIFTLYGKNVCVGKISNILNKYGDELLEYDVLRCSKNGNMLILLDEMFVKNCPILVTMDPVSLYIYEIRLVTKRDQITWGESLEKLKGSDTIIRAIGDEGAGLRAAVKNQFGEDHYGADHFHLLSPFHKLILKTSSQSYRDGQARDKALLILLENEDKRKTLKLQKEYDLVDEEAKRTSYISSNLSYLFLLLCAQLRPVDTCRGLLRNKNKAKEQCLAILELIGDLDHEAVQVEAKKWIKKLPFALGYLGETPQVLEKLKEIIPDELYLQSFLMLYAYTKRLPSVHSSKKEWIKKNKQFWEEALREDLGDFEMKRLWKRAEKELETLVRASSMIENINGKLRRFCETSRGQINQARLNLIRFYFNHKVFARGKRKGYSPIELHLDLDPENRVHWASSLLDKVKEINLEKTKISA